MKWHYSTKIKTFDSAQPRNRSRPFSSWEVGSGHETIWWINLPHHIMVVVNVNWHILELVRDMQIVFLAPEWLQWPECCRCPVGQGHTGYSMLTEYWPTLFPGLQSHNNLKWMMCVHSMSGPSPSHCMGAYPLYEHEFSTFMMYMG